MPRPAHIAFAFLIFASLVFPIALVGQQKKNERQTQPERDAAAAAATTPTGGDVTDDGRQDDELLKIETNLISFPVIVNNRDGVYVPDMRKEEFSVVEDGAEQQLVFFAAVTQPFHVVLMLDTSASTEEKLSFIQQAAGEFVEQLQPEDRVKVISFDDEIRDHNAFTNNPAEIKRAIRASRPGKGTKLYDAVQLALDQLRPVRGRKAIVIFTDGVDYRSDNFRYHHNVRALEESGVIVYPIRYDTRAETEQLARRQAEGGQLSDLGAILTGEGSNDESASPRGTTGTTFPGGSIPLPGGQGGIGGLPFPAPVIVSRPRGSDPNDPRRPGGGRDSDPRDDSTRRTPSRDDSIGRLLDSLYKTADGYLDDLALKSGGRLTRADTLALLPAAFKQIANELRTQYSIGYYPINPVTNGGYRKVKVKTTRKGATVRTRPGYIAKVTKR